jgi:hypothetical protein
VDAPPTKVKFDLSVDFKTQQFPLSLALLFRKIWVAILTVSSYSRGETIPEKRGTYLSALDRGTALHEDEDGQAYQACCGGLAIAGASHNESLLRCFLTVSAVPSK